MSSPRKSFKTEKGTELPLLNLKGKEYLQVMHRLVWFRERFPTAVVKTQMVEHQGAGKDEYYIFRAEIFLDSDRGPSLIATGHKRESVGSFADAMEKAESGAVGRALAMLGIGTAFAADDLDEGDRLADSPAPVMEKAESTTGESTVTSMTSGRRPSFRKNVVTPTEKAAVSDDI